MCVSCSARFDSPALMDGAFRCEKVNTSPTGVLLCSLSLQIAASLCPCVCLCLFVYDGRCAEQLCSDLLACCVHCAFIVCCVYFFASLLEKEDPV